MLWLCICEETCWLKIVFLFASSWARHSRSYSEKSFLISSETRVILMRADSWYYCCSSLDSRPILTFLWCLSYFLKSYISLSCTLLLPISHWFSFLHWSLSRVAISSSSVNESKRCFNYSSWFDRCSVNFKSPSTVPSYSTDPNVGSWTWCCTDVYPSEAYIRPYFRRRPFFASVSNIGKTKCLTTCAASWGVTFDILISSFYLSPWNCRAYEMLLAAGVEGPESLLRSLFWGLYLVLPRLGVNIWLLSLMWSSLMSLIPVKGLYESLFLVLWGWTYIILFLCLFADITLFRIKISPSWKSPKDLWVCAKSIVLVWSFRVAGLVVACSVSDMSLFDFRIGFGCWASSIIHTFFPSSATASSVKVPV